MLSFLTILTPQFLSVLHLARLKLILSFQEVSIVTSVQLIVGSQDIASIRNYWVESVRIITLHGLILNVPNAHQRLHILLNLLLSLIVEPFCHISISMTVKAVLYLLNLCKLVRLGVDLRLELVLILLNLRLDS